MPNDAGIQWHVSGLANDPRIEAEVQEEGKEPIRVTMNMHTLESLPDHLKQLPKTDLTL